ncbi:unnamed protein product [Linum trigynum]|uniref:Secreted protein n=1 Tax=Linum trigynum TaxID=586398 RepID=A0AAV2FPK5_9ROSI
MVLAAFFFSFTSHLNDQVLPAFSNRSTATVATIRTRISSRSLTVRASTAQNPKDDDDDDSPTLWRIHLPECHHR